MGVAHICDLCGDRWPRIVAKSMDHYDRTYSFETGKETPGRFVYEICSDCWDAIKLKRKALLAKQKAKVKSE